MSERLVQSDYMHFAKFGADARYRLASSGVADCVLDDLQLTLDDLALHGPNAGGYAPLRDRVAARYGVDPACVVMPGGGCSFSNHLALSAMLSPGDEVLVEAPTYELLTSTLSYLQARIRTFERIPADGPRRDLPVEDARRDVGVIGRGLSPTDRAGVRRDAHEADELVGEGLELLDRKHAITVLG